MRTISSVLGVVGVVVTAGSAAAAPFDFSKPLKTPYARKEPLAIRGVTITPEKVQRFGSLEMTVDLSATYDNPFDAGDVTLDARILTPSKKRVDVPGFYYQAFARELTGGKEVLTAVGRPSWRLRFMPKEVGVHTVTLRVHDRSGTGVLPNRRFTVAPSSLPGMVRVSPRDPRFLERENGKPFFPIGANLCYAGPRGTFEYDRWLTAYARAGCNYGRIWLSPGNTTFGMERPGVPKDGAGIGQIDLANAWRTDLVLSAARSRGLHLMLTVESHRVLTEQQPSAPMWDGSPLNAKNGGPLQKPADFWTDQTMEGLYLNKLRYLVARYGASANLLAWELWDEVDLISGYRTEPAKAWHARVAGLLRKLDPHGHLITTSFSRLEGDPAIDTLPGIDLVQTHQFGGPDSTAGFASALQMKSRYKKPHLASTVGGAWQGGQKELDPEALQIRPPLWVGIASGGAGGVMPWGWDSYIEPQQLYDALTPATRFVTGINWPSEGFRVVKPRVEWARRPQDVTFRSIPVPGGPISWSASEFNRPRTVTVTSRGIGGQLPVSGIQHGTQANAALRNPITFEVDLTAAGRLDIRVEDVSGNGGAKLNATVDGKPALEFDFADTDPSARPLGQYAGSYQVTIPVGKHTVEVSNVGSDWFLASYRFLDVLEPTGPAIDAWASVGNGTAVAWVRNQDYTWQRTGILKEMPKPEPPSVLVLPGTPMGEWRAELWDTRSGKVVGVRSVTVGKNGEARISLPSLTKDLGMRMRRTASGAKP